MLHLLCGTVYLQTSSGAYHSRTHRHCRLQWVVKFQEMSLVENVIDALRYFNWIPTSIYSVLTPSTPSVPNCCCSNGSASYWSNLTFLILDIRVLWRSVLSARVPECQRLKMLGQTSMAKCRTLTGSAVKGLMSVDCICVVTSLAPGRRLSDARRRCMQCLATLVTSRALTTAARNRNGPPKSYRDRPPAVSASRSDRVNASLLSHLRYTERQWLVDNGRIPLGYPAANYQQAPNGTRSDGSWVTRRRPKSAGIETSGA